MIRNDLLKAVLLSIVACICIIIGSLMFKDTKLDAFLKIQSQFLKTKQQNNNILYDDGNYTQKVDLTGNYDIKINPERINDECARIGYQMYIKSCVQLIGLKRQLKHRLFMYIPRHGNPEKELEYGIVFYYPNMTVAAFMIADDDKQEYYITKYVQVNRIHKLVGVAYNNVLMQMNMTYNQYHGLWKEYEIPEIKKINLQYNTILHGFQRKTETKPDNEYKCENTTNTSVTTTMTLQNWTNLTKPININTELQVSVLSQNVTLLVNILSDVIANKDIHKISQNYNNLTNDIKGKIDINNIKQKLEDNEIMKEEHQSYKNEIQRLRNIQMESTSNTNSIDSDNADMSFLKWASYYDGNTLSE